MKMSNSKLKSARRCLKQYEYKFGRKLASNAPALPMKRGLWLHRLLQAKYTEEGGWQRCLKRELQPEFDKMFDEEKEMYGDLPTICRNIMRSYDYHWAEEDDTFEVLGAEIEFEVPVPHGHTITGRIDLCIQDEFGIWLVEHKSHKTIPRADYRFLDVQTSLYVWAANRGHLFPEPITGVLWNYIRTKPPTKPALLKNGSRLSLKKIDTDLLTFVGAIQEYGLNPRDYRDKILALKRQNSFFSRYRVPKEKGVTQQIVREAISTADMLDKKPYPTRTIERSCEFSCSYRDLCITELYGGDTDQVIKDRYHVRKEGEYYADDYGEVSV